MLPTGRGQDFQGIFSNWAAARRKKQKQNRAAASGPQPRIRTSNRELRTLLGLDPNRENATREECQRESQIPDRM